MKKFLRNYFVIAIAFAIANLFLVHKSFGQGTQTFNNPANNGLPANTFTVPAGVTSVTVQCWAGGGKGSTASSGNVGGGGGGGGGFSRKVIAVIPGNTYTINVGGGSATTAPGGDSWFIDNTTVLAHGGNSVANNTNTGGTGGAVGIGDVGGVFAGGTGATGTNGGGGGGGGSSAGTANNGNNGAVTAGGTAPAGGGNGGNGGAATLGANNGVAGSSPGGGGGGGFRGITGTGNGGNGANGQVIITWTCPAATISYSPSSLCKSATSATVNLTGSAGGTFSATPAGLSINPSTGEINPSTSASGNYTVHYQIASGGNGCTAVDATFPVTILTFPVSTVTNQSNITCFAANDGTIEVTASNGASPYTFSVDNGANYFPATGTDLRLFTGLLPNTPYRVRVKDSNGCISK